MEPPIEVSPLARFVLKRIGSILLSLWGVSVLVFLMVQLIPGNPARAMLGERATEEAVRELEHTLGLDRPLIVQYAAFLSRAVRLDLGRSIKTNESVIREIWSRFPATLELTLVAMAFAVTAGILVGAVAATQRGRLLDYAGMAAALVGVSIPIYCLGLLLILVLSSGLGILPSGGRGDASVTVVSGFLLIDSALSGSWGAIRSSLAHLLLPAVALGTVPLAIISRITRSSLLEVLDQDYIRTVRAAGLPERTVLLKYALKNALIPVLTVVGLEFGYLLGGAVMTETIFSWPGLGRWLVTSVAARDMPAIQGGVLFVAVLFMGITFVVDILYVVIDPRVRLGGE